MDLDVSAKARMLGLLVAAFLVGVLVWLADRPADPSPSASVPPARTLAQPMAGAAELSASGAAVSSVGLPASSGPAVQKPAPAASVPAWKLPKAFPVAGSLAEAFQEVQRTLQGPATAREQLQAATFLNVCKGADAAVKAMFAMRDQQHPVHRQLESQYGESEMRKAIEGQQELQRRCQVFDTATLARASELFKAAYEGGEKEAAIPYLLWLSTEGRRSARPELLNKLQGDIQEVAEDGELTALWQLSMLPSTRTFGHSEVQRQAYRAALRLINREMLVAELAAQLEASSEATEKDLAHWVAAPALSPEERRDAEALAARVFERWRKRQASGG